MNEFEFHLSKRTAKMSVAIGILAVTILTYLIFSKVDNYLIFCGLLIIGVIAALSLLIFWILVGLTFLHLKQGATKVENLLKLKENASPVSLNLKQIKEMILYGYTKNSEGRVLSVPPKNAMIKKATSEEQQKIEYYEKLQKGESTDG